MSNEKLFTAIYIPETPFIDEKLKINNHSFELIKSTKISDVLYHFIYKKNNEEIHTFYFNGDEDEKDKTLFIENNQLYDKFKDQFWGGGQRY